MKPKSPLTLIATAFLLATPIFSLNASDSNFFSGLIIEGMVEGSGNYFEIKDSKYLNATLKSDEEIKIVLESIPEMVTMMIEPLSLAASTSITLGGFHPQTAYYKYQDDYHNLAEFVTDENGNYSYVQDLAKPHLIFIQSRKSTKFIKDDATGGDCNLIGEWDFDSKTCTLVTDLSETMQIDNDGITLDGNGHKITGNYTGYGVFLPVKKNTVVKNLIVSHFSYGINLSYSANNTISDNTVLNNSLGISLWPANTNNTLTKNTASNNYIGIYLVGSSENSLIDNITSNNTNSGIALVDLSNNNTLTNNDELNNGSDGIIFLSSQNNNLTGNTVLNSNSGITLVSSSNNIFNGNTISNSTNYGFYLHNSSNNIITKNTVSDNNLGVSFGQYSSYNQVYNNNFVNNFTQSDVWTSYNLFNLDKPIGGNYWSDYDTIVEGCADEDNDGFCDNPYGVQGASGSQDNYPFTKENGWEAPPEPEKWSFATITDLHIGRGYSDYDGAGCGSYGEGEDYYLTERLKKVVNWINENKNNVDCDRTKCPIKFVAVLGDISDSGEKSEYSKAMSILNGLNDPNKDGNTADGIPYVPVFGNHDILPYTDSEKLTTSLGEGYFDEIFWDENATNTKLMKERLNFTRDEANPDYKNFTLKYGDTNFIGLDFVSRATTTSGGVGSEAVIYPETENWLTNNLSQYQGKEKVFLLSHYPFAEPKSRTIYNIIKIPFDFGNFSTSEIEKIKGTMENYENISTGTQILGTFGGHIHGFEKFGKEFTEIGQISLSPVDLFLDANWEYPSIVSTPVISAEALMVSGNKQDISNKGVIRIIKLEGDTTDASTTEGKFPTLNPYISFDFTKADTILPCVFFKAHLFTQRNYSLVWDFGDGQSDSNIWQNHCYSEGETYNVKLTAIDRETGETEYITRQIEVKEGIIPKIIKIADSAKDTLELISMELGENVTEFGRTMKDMILVQVKHSPADAIGLINVHFEQATSDIDLISLVADANSTNKKSILYMLNWIEVIEKEKILFIPK
jgi:parallel beta-helix repeat protein